MHVSFAISSQSQQALQLTANQLASGKRIITSASVDPSGLAIAAALTSQASGFDQGASNAQDAINASAVAQGAIATISDAAQRLQTLSVAATNDLRSASDRANLQTEANANTQEINSVSAGTNFNGVQLLDGSTPTAAVQTGAGEGSITNVALPSSTSSALGLSNVDLSSSASATTSEYATDAAIASIGSSQATLGSQTVALAIDQQNGEVASNNLTASASSIADADPMVRSTNYANAQTVSRIQIALQVQANLAATSVLGMFPR